MDDYLKEALDIAKAQAGVRIMTEDEITALVRRLSNQFKALSGEALTAPPLSDEKDARRSIRERHIMCMECGRNYRILTRRHLAHHGLTADEYREKWGLKKNTPLVSRALQKERRRKMQEIRLWEKRRDRKDVPGRS